MIKLDNVNIYWLDKQLFWFTAGFHLHNFYQLYTGEIKCIMSSSRRLFFLVALYPYIKKIYTSYMVCYIYKEKVFNIRAQSAGTVGYTHCISSPTTVLDMTLNYLMVWLQFWSFGEYPSLPLLPGPFWPKVVVPVRFPSTGQIESVSWVWH